MCTHSVTNRPVNGVTVRLQSKDNATVIAYTNLNGELKVNVPAGEYQAFVSKPGYELVGGETTAAGVKMLTVEVGSDGNIKDKIKVYKL